MDMIKTIKRCIICMLMMNLSNIVLAQDVSDKTVLLDKVVISESAIRLEGIINKSGHDVEIKIQNGTEQRTSIKIRKGESHPFDLECTRVQANPIGQDVANGGGGIIWNEKKTGIEWNKIQKSKETISFKKIPKTSERISEETLKLNAIASDNVSKIKTVDGESVVVIFLHKLDKDLYWSASSIDNDVKMINDHIVSIKNWIDKETYIIENGLVDYIKSEGRKIEEFKDKINKITNKYLSYYSKYIIESDFDYEASIIHILKERVSRRETAIQNLNQAIDSIENSSFFDLNNNNQQTLVNIGIIGSVVLVLIVWLSILTIRKKNGFTPTNAQQSPTNETSSSIVVRRKTTSILKKQSLEDVINNNAYYRIDCADFCNDSAVRRMYIKNTCVKDIYNMYADDLRNPDNPKEDGCMVLGRWVHDDQTNEYYVSLEEIVRPGDDAVFQEYELNFGGKIKLRVAEKLRKLRRDTNLQYDLTCWVHSHPGLGVFFSNSDSSVQMQLKHPSHPNFLTAIVVDILTPQQEFGIFTFKHDSSINSRNDLKKMYSLEELHKWAVKSERNSYKPDDYYNVLSKAECKNDECQGIQLSNGAIIDIASITTDENTGLVGWIYGFATNCIGENEFVINSVLTLENAAEGEPLGCLVIDNECNISSISNKIIDYVDKIKFVMFYSIKNETITTIPVIDMQLSVNEKIYSEEKLEDLKIWTRRKR